MSIRRALRCRSRSTLPATPAVGRLGRAWIRSEIEVTRLAVGRCGFCTGEATFLSEHADFARNGIGAKPQRGRSATGPHDAAANPGNRLFCYSREHGVAFHRDMDSAELPPTPTSGGGVDPLSPARWACITVNIVASRRMWWMR